MIGLLLVVAAAFGVQDTVGVAVNMSAARVAVGDVVIYEVTVTTPGRAPDEVQLPQFAGGLVMQSTRRYDEYSIRFPGGRIRTTRFEVHLRARSAGRYAIPPVVVAHEGRRYASRSVALQVVPAGSLPPGARSGSPRVEGFTPSAVGPDGEALLRARLEPDTVFVGEQATLIVDALISDDLRTRLRRAPEYLTPSVSGMWTQDLTDVAGTRVEWSASRRYEVQTFRRAYFPLEVGTFTVPEARLLYEARRGFLFTPYSEELTSAPLDLVVLPLPDGDVPASFTGAVGDYSISATLAPANLAVGDAALLTVVVRGDGNLKALPAPRIPAAPVALDSPTEDADVEPASGVVSGRKTFTWAVVPERAGLIEIGPIEYGFFDPDAREYRVARTGVLALEVAPADSSAAAVAPQALAALRTRPTPDPFGGLRGATGAALAVAPVVLAGAFLLVRRSRERARVTPSRRALRRRLHQRLDELAAPARVSDARFFDEVGQAARDWLAERFARPELRASSAGALATGLEAASVPAALAGALRDLIERLERARFQPTPPSPDERLRLLQRTRDTLDRMDRVAGARRRQAGAVVILLALAAHAGIAGAQDGARPTLAEIRAAHEDGRALEAATLARRYVRAEPRDPAGWYDLGTVEAARGERGVATWALLRALALDPRADDIAHNLDVLGVEDATRRVAAPALPLRPGELRALALAAWWLTVFIALLAWLRRSRGLIFGAASSAATSVLLAALLVAPGVAPDSAIPFDPAAPVRAAPHLRAPVLRDVGSGPLRVVERRDGWMRVRNALAEEGWIERSEVGLIE
ncbi:MAG TPA: BatD family protein [Longimicrobiales bacterium]